MPRRKGIFKRKGRNQWYAHVYANGKDHMVALGTDAKAAGVRLKALQAPGAFTEPNQMTVNEAVDRWITLYVQVHRNEAGQRLALFRANTYLKKFMGAMLLSKVGPDDLRSYRLWLQEQSIALQTVAHVLSDARCFFGWAVDTGLITHTPVRRRLLPKIQEQPPKTLSDDQVMQLIQLPEPYGFTCRLALATGLRWSELCRVTSEDVENGFLVVAHKTKSGKIRRVPLSQRMLAEVRLHIGPLVPWFLPRSDMFNYSVRRMTGIKDFHAHRLRHTFASQWIARGGNLASLQIILGHASVTTTQRYAKLSDEQVAREARELEARDAMRENEAKEG